MAERRPLELSTPVSATDHTLGPDDAAITLVEYGDYECPNCKQAAPAVKLVLARFASRVRFVYRHFPLEELHPHARRAAEAAECGGAQGRFWDMHELLFDNQLRLGTRQLYGYALRLQLDMARYALEMSEELHLQRIREHQRSGVNSGMRATPGFFINGRIQDVSYGLRSLSEGIEDALRRQDNGGVD